MAGDFDEPLRTLALTCACGARNERDLPYNMVAPDKCWACGQPLHPTPERPASQWIQTFSGLQYWPLDPRAADVRVEDIAHHLGNICRFSGACRRFYSVAEHSSHVSHVVDAALMFRQDVDEETKRRLVLLAHLHDAAEYVPPHDVARPVKYADECAFLREVERRNEAAIFEALGVADIVDTDGLIKQADNAMLIAEQEALMGEPPAAWESLVVDGALLEVARYRMMLANKHGVSGAGSPEKAGRAWLLRYHELTEF